jgi:hypothetical protein
MRHVTLTARCFPPLAKLALAGVALVPLACGGSGKTSGSGGQGGGGVATTSTAATTNGVGSTGATTGTANATTGTANPGMCASDPLKTGLVAQQTGVSVDAFDCQILTAAAKYGEPDPMIIKAIIYVESRFDQVSVACPNLPCGTPNGWTAMESGCYGLMQVVPACGPTPGNEGLLSNGHPDLTTDMAASGWANSIFNPAVNIDDGVSGIAANRTQEKQKFAGCTEDQYTLMAIGDYNSYGSTKSCTVYNQAYDSGVLMAYTMYAMAAGYAAHSYP